MRRVFITGATGRIGKVLREGLRGYYPILRVSHRTLARLGEARSGEELNAADLCNFEEVDVAMEGVDAVVHMGGTPREDDWDRIHRNNIIGTYNVFEAARRHGVSRMIFGSSNHVVGYYRRCRRVGVDEPPRPDSRYGVSKVFGEALGRLYADKYGMSVICQRIGSFFPKPRNIRMLSTWISHRDIVHLTRCCLDARDVHFEVIYGVSANKRKWWNDPVAVRLGYRPQDNAEDYAQEIIASQKPEDEPVIERLFHGGRFCGMEFTGDPERIE